jgi:hypothetical protein
MRDRLNDMNQLLVIVFSPLPFRLLTLQRLYHDAFGLL